MALNLNRSTLDDVMKDPHKGTFTLAIGTALVVLFMLVVAIRPAVVSVFKQLADNDIRRGYIVEQDKKIQILTDLIELRSQYVFEIDLLNESLPENDDIEYVVRNISDYFDSKDDLEFGAATIEYAPALITGKTESPKPIKAIVVKMTFNSDVDEASNFINYLESFPRIIDLKSLNYKANENEESPLPLTGSVEFILYNINIDSQVI